MTGQTFARLFHLSLIVAFLLSGGVVGCSLVPETKVEMEFSAGEQVVPPGKCTVLHWQVQAPRDYSVSLDGQEVSRVGEREVCPEKSSTYALMVGVPGQPLTKRMTVEVTGERVVEGPPPPAPGVGPGPGGPAVNLLFRAEPDVIPRGNCTVLRWEVNPPGEWPMFLDGQPVPPRGERQVCPPETRAYELAARVPPAQGGPLQALVMVQVRGEPPQPPPPASGPISIELLAEPDPTQSGCTQLRWTVTQGEWPVTLNGQPVPWVGQRQVCPQKATSYELWVAAPPEKGGPQLRVVTALPSIAPQQAAPPQPPPPASGPISIEFLADPDPTQSGCTQLRWTVTQGEWPVTLDGQPVPWVGQRQVCPQKATSYELEVVAPPERGGRQQRVVTALPGGAPAEPAEPATPQQAAQPQPTTQPPPAAPAAPSKSGADITPTDLYPDNQPKGQMWVRITNNGPETLTNKKVEVSGTANAFPPGSGNVAIPYLYTGTQFTLNLAPGQTQAFNLGWPIDNSQNRYEFSVTVKAKDFTDPNSGNNTYTESLSAVGGAAAGPGGPAAPPAAQPSGSTADLRVTDLYPQNLPQGKVWTRVTNDGPATLNNAEVEMKCGMSGTALSAGSPGYSHVEAPWSAYLTLKPGETKAIETKMTVDTNQYSYDAWCTVMPKTVTDPNLNNNKYSEKITGPAAPPGGGSWGILTADLAVTDLFPQNQPKGAVMFRLTNNGPGTPGGVDVPTTCRATVHAYTFGPTPSTVEKKFNTTVASSPGQTTVHYTGIDVDTSQNWYDVSCTVSPGFKDTNSANNTYSEKIPPSP